MIRFFRRIRKSLLADNKFNKYLIYAIGEIALVMIGILLALQVNIWNENRKERQAIKRGYSSIIEEIDLNIKRAYGFIHRDSLLISDHRRSLNILDKNQLDSIDVLKKLIGSTATTWGNRYTFPALEEFLRLDHISSITNTQIKENFVQFTDLIEATKGGDAYNRKQYTESIEPFIVRNINYTDIAHESFSDFLVNGGPKTNFTALFNDLSLWNIITLKLETLSVQKDSTKKFIEFMTEHKKALQKSLEENNL